MNETVKIYWKGPIRESSQFRITFVICSIPKENLLVMPALWRELLLRCCQTDWLEHVWVDADCTPREHCSYNITESLRLKGTTMHHLAQPLCSSTMQNLSRQFWKIPPVRETPQFLWAIYSSVIATQKGNSSLCSVRCFCASVSALFLLSYCSTPPRIAWLHPLQIPIDPDVGPYHLFLI